MIKLHILLVIVAIPFLSGFPIRGSKANQESRYDFPKHDSTASVLRFGGDCLLTDHYEDYVGDSVSHAFTDFDLLKAADVAMVNLECPITIRGKRVEKPFNFRMHPRFLPALTTAGIDAVSIANNHIYDFGDVGLFDTISYLDSAGIFHAGAGHNATEAHAPVIVTAKDKRIALLAYYGGGEAPKATSRKPGVADRNIRKIRADIARIKEDSSAEYIVVNLHWGTEKAPVPDERQVVFAHRVIDAGADLIIGHHPHVLQGIEKYKSGVIVYSLGNFVFGGNSRDTYDTAIFEVRLEDKDVAYRLIPVRIEQWRAIELSGSKRDEVVNHVRELSSIFAESIFTQ